MGIYEELIARGLIAQVTNEDEIREMVNNGKATFYIGFDCTADSLHVGHFMALCLMKRLQMAGNKPIALIGDGTTMIGDPSGRTRILPDVQQFCFNGMHGCNDWCCRKYTPSGARRPLWNSCRCGCISWGTDSRTACILYKAESWISKDFTYSSFHRYYGSGTLLISCNL